MTNGNIKNGIFLNNKWRYYWEGVVFIFFAINYPWECALLVFRVFKGVHLKRAISSEEQWTRELLKHEKFHSGKLSTIEWVVMSNHLYILFAVPFKKKFLNRLLNTHLCKKDKYSFCKNIYTFSFNILDIHVMHIIF